MSPLLLAYLALPGSQKGGGRIDATFWGDFAEGAAAAVDGLVGADALLDDPMFFPRSSGFDPRRVGRPSTPRATRYVGESVITKRIDGKLEAGAQGASWRRHNQWPA